VDLGSNDFLKAIIAGSDTFDIKRPVAIAVRHGLLYIADAGNKGMVLTYDLQKKRISPINGAGELIADEASDIYVTKDGSFYITDTLGKRVLHLDEDGDFIKEFRSGPNISRPIAVTVNEDSGDVFIADEVYSKIIVFNQRGEPVRGMGGRGVGEGKFRIITDMIKVSGGFLVSDRIELSVQMLDERGNYQGDFGAKELYFPTALAADKFGRVYVAEKVDSTIKVFLNGELIDTIGKNGYGDGEFRHISDMKLVNRKLYVADSLNGRIQVFEILPPIAKLGMLQ
jgi:DNA-binding beta-propeller fold protein YncE